MFLLICTIVWVQFQNIVKLLATGICFSCTQLLAQYVHPFGIFDRTAEQHDLTVGDYQIDLMINNESLFHDLHSFRDKSNRMLFSEQTFLSSFQDSVVENSHNYFDFRLPQKWDPYSQDLNQLKFADLSGKSFSLDIIPNLLKASNSDEKTILEQFVSFLENWGNFDTKLKENYSFWGPDYSSQFSYSTLPPQADRQLSLSNHSKQSSNSFNRELGDHTKLVRSEFITTTDLLQRYPVFYPSINPVSFRGFDIFEISELQSIDTTFASTPLPFQNTSNEQNNLTSLRQRRASVTYYWEMTSFDGSSNDNDTLTLDINHSNDDLTVIIRPLSSGTVGTGESNSTDGVVGAPSDYASFIQSDQTYSNIIQFNNSAYTPNNPITVDASAIEYYMNYYYGDWEITGPSSNNYSLIYYSAVPEPSTYFMTGALLCLVGCNQTSRKSLQKLFSKASFRPKKKATCQKVTDQIS